MTVNILKKVQQHVLLVQRGIFVKAIHMKLLPMAQQVTLAQRHAPRVHTVRLAHPHAQHAQVVKLQVAQGKPAVKTVATTQMLPHGKQPHGQIILFLTCVRLKLVMPDRSKVTINVHSVERGHTAVVGQQHRVQIVQRGHIRAQKENHRAMIVLEEQNIVAKKQPHVPM